MEIQLQKIEDEVGKLENYVNNNKENINEKEVIEKLQEINKCFLQNVIIKINSNRLEIYPVEVEIYYYKEGVFEDGYCHKNELQKGKDDDGKYNDRFGKLYFHRASRSKSKEALIDTSYYGGVDICLSRGDYYLSILLRSVYVKDRTNNKKNIFITGIHRIVNRITDELESLLEYGDINIKYKIYENQEEKEKFLKSEKEVNIQDFEFKYINRWRIKNTAYFEHDKEKNFTLNTYIDNKKITSKMVKPKE